MCVKMESTKLREGRKGNNRRRGGRKEEKRELRRMKNAKSEEVASWPQFPVTEDIENTVDILEPEASLDLENFDNGKSRMLCSFIRLLICWRARVFFICTKMSVNARQFEVAFVDERKKSLSNKSDVLKEVQIHIEIITIANFPTRSKSNENSTERRKICSFLKACRTYF